MTWADARRAIDAAVPAALEAGAEHLLDRSNRDVPTDSRELRDSGKVSVDGDLAAVSYGRGESAAYAVRQHEDMDSQHDDGSAKFLEQAMHAHGDEVLQIMAARIRRSLGT